VRSRVRARPVRRARQTELVKRIRDKANDAPALLDDEPEYPADASDAARKRLKTSHNKLLDARFEKLSDEHVTEPAMKDLRAFASALGVRVKAVKVDAKEHDDKSKRKSPLKLAHVLITAKSVASLEARDRGGAEDDEETDLGRVPVITLVPTRPRSRGARRSSRTSSGASLRPGSLGFNARPRRFSTPTDAPLNAAPTSLLRADARPSARASRRRRRRATSTPS